MPATLYSNDGRSYLVIDSLTPLEYASDLGFEANVRVAGEYWDGDETHPYSAAVEGLWLRRADLAALRDHVLQWTQQPLDRLTPDSLDAEFELARLPSQSLRIEFARRSDAISGRNPVVSIEIRAVRWETRLNFVTDRSCLALFVSELAVDLA